jgi:AraC-like DNA-binding protein
VAAGTAALSKSAQLRDSAIADSGISGKCTRPDGHRPQNDLVGHPAEDINRRLLRARDLMDRHYARPLDVDALARTALMARSHFIREFKRVFAETPHRYLQRRRVERAMFLLRHTHRTVTDICQAVGFTSLGTFSRTFTGIIGATPTAYRETTQAQHQVAPTSFAMRWTRPASRSVD